MRVTSATFFIPQHLLPLYSRRYKRDKTKKQQIDPRFTSPIFRRQKGIKEQRANN